MRAQNHYAKLQDTIRNLAANYPAQLDATKTVIDIEGQNSTMQYINEAGELEYEPSDRSASGQYDVVREPGKPGEPSEPAEWDEKVRQWANSAAEEGFGHTPSQDAHPDTAAAATSAHDHASVIDSATANETVSSQTPAQAKEELVTYIRTISSTIDGVLESVAKFGSKIHASAQRILNQHASLASQVQKLSDELRRGAQIVSATPLESEDCDFHEPVTANEGFRKILSLFAIVCGVTERLFQKALEDHGQWSVQSCAVKWDSIADQFEWETTWPLLSAFTLLPFSDVDDEEAGVERQKKLQGMKKGGVDAFDQLFERQRLLSATRTSDKLAPSGSEAATGTGSLEDSSS